MQKNCKIKTNTKKDCCFVVWKAINSELDKNRNGVEGLLFYFISRMLYCPGQILEAMVLSQHPVLSSRNVRPRTPCHTQRKLQGTLLRLGLWFVQRRRTHNLIKERDLMVYEQMELPNISLPAINLNTSCWGQANSNRISTGYGNKSTEAACAFIILRVPSKIHRLVDTRLVRNI